MELSNELPWFLQGTAALEAYKNPERFIALDYETTNFTRGSAHDERNEIVLACWMVVTPDGITRKHHWGNQYEQSELEKDVREAQFVVAHNAGFELGWLKRSGIDLRDVLVFDTFLAEWVIGGNRYQLQDLGLGVTAERWGLGDKEDIASYLIKKGVCPSEMPREWLLPYCHKDVELSYELFLKQRDTLVKDNLLHLALTRNLTVAALTDMEFNPCELDADAVNDVYNKSVKEFQELEVGLSAMAEGVNMNSSKQLATFLYDTLGFSPPIDKRTKEPIKTKGGALSTTVDTLSLLESQTSEQDKFLTMYKRRNRLSALLTKNLEFFKAVVDEREGRFIGKFNMGNTQTHRLSSSGVPIKLKAFSEPKAPQLQNLPRELKYLFTAHDEGWVVVESDGAQLEYRVAVDLGRDKVGYKEICEGVDIHAVTAQVLSDAGEPTTRQEAKSRTFTPLFGGGGKTKAEKNYVEFFRDKYAGITETQRQWALATASKGWFQTPYGMRFYFPGTKMQASGYITNSTSIFNFPIQGYSTGEIIPIALVYLWHRTKDKPVVLWNTIHDSVAARVREDFVSEYEDIAKQSFTYDVYKHLKEVYKYSFRVPLGLGIKAAKRWSDTKEEVSINVWADGRETRNTK